jgi:hypothetical protein
MAAPKTMKEALERVEEDEAREDEVRLEAPTPAMRQAVASYRSEPPPAVPSPSVVPPAVARSAPPKGKKWTRMIHNVNGRQVDLDVLVDDPASK